jgi:hypothetical protein
MRRGLALLALLVVGACAPAMAVAAPPVPEDDPFYAVPAGIDELANGAVLASRQITAYSGPLPMPARAWQVKYKTLDNEGAPTATVTTVMVPTAPWTGRGPRPLVSYQVAEDGVGGKCSASYALSGGHSGSNAESETSAMREALRRGWAVTAPDYEGPDSAFLGPDIEAQGTLDGIRAALGFAPAGLRAGTPIALWGYSGGALASTLAAQLQPAYAPDLALAGVALGGAVGDLNASMAAFDKIGAGGAAVIVGLVGLDRAYPEKNLTQYLNPAGRKAYAASQRDCLGDAIGKYPGKKVSDFGTVTDDVRQMLRDISPLGRAGVPSAPVYDYHASQDELAPVGPDRELMAGWCTQGVTVQHVELPGEHFSMVATGLPGVLSFLTDRFAGRPATSTCG